MFRRRPSACDGHPAGKEGLHYRLFVRQAVVVSDHEMVFPLCPEADHPAGLLEDSPYPRSHPSGGATRDLEANGPFRRRQEAGSGKNNHRGQGKGDFALHKRPL